MITAVIPTFNCVKYLKQCISTLLEFSDTQPKVLVVVDGSTDGTVEYLQSHGISYLYRYEASRPESERKGGTRSELIGRCYQNLDLGAMRAETPWVYFGNDDTVFSPGWDSRLLQAAADMKQDGFVANQIVEPAVEIPAYPGNLAMNLGQDISRFHMDSWLVFCKAQAKIQAYEKSGLNIGILCRRSFYLEKIIPLGGYRWMDSPPDNMWSNFEFRRIVGVPLYHFSGRSSRCGGE